MRPISILWTDDEIDLLKPHIIFLEQKGYSVDTASNGSDAIEKVKSNTYDLVFLDESMPGISGLETLSKLKTIDGNLPIIMITKNEEEDIMDAAIGSKISDYLLKPVNPKQILLTIKKHVDNTRLINKETTSAYQSEFAQLGMQINAASTFNDWVEVHKKLVYWETELDQLEDAGMKEILLTQKTEANSEFSKFIRKNYANWFSNLSEAPLLSPNVLKNKVFPLLREKQKVVFILIDNLRYDQWKTISGLLNESYYFNEEGIYSSIIPTATQYARNALFAGLMPLEIKKLYPKLWLDDTDEGGKNLKEEELLKHNLQRHKLDVSISYDKISDLKFGKKLSDNYKQLLGYDLSVIIYNFVDMLSHARTEMKVIQELASDEAAYRSLTLSWFKHSYLLDLLKALAREQVKVIITTDHGTVKVQNPLKVVGDRDTSVNLRYKIGRNISFKSKDIWEVSNPEKIHLPKINLSSTFVFASGNDFMAYPNNFNHYANYYKNTFQHGGISMEEILIPYIELTPKN
jgi:DNA-binding response OmpR family regulator